MDLWTGRFEFCKTSSERTRVNHTNWSLDLIWFVKIGNKGNFTVWTDCFLFLRSSRIWKPAYGIIIAEVQKCCVRSRWGGQRSLGQEQRRPAERTEEEQNKNEKRKISSSEALRSHFNVQLQLSKCQWVCACVCVGGGTHTPGRSWRANQRLDGLLLHPDELLKDGTRPEICFFGVGGSGSGTTVTLINLAHASGPTHPPTSTNQIRGSWRFTS